MKRIILAAAIMMCGMSVYAQTEKEIKNDTIPVTIDSKVELIEDRTTNRKGEPVSKYYMVIGDELIKTSKSVADYFRLAEMHGAKCSLAIVKNRKNNKKRVILN